MTFVLRGRDLRCPVNRKLAYPTADSATDAIEAAWTRPQTGPRTRVMPKRAYLCPECGWWHLSSHWSTSDAS